MLLGALDQGTSSTRFILFDEKTAEVVGNVQKEHTQYHPQPGWVEQDPEEILASCEHCIRGALAMAQATARDVRAIGVTNQRETTVIFSKTTGKAACRAVSWNCSRTAEIAEKYKQRAGGWVRRKTGLPVASYFSATKLVWLFEAHPELAKSEDLVFGTMDVYLVWHLTAGRHVTDSTNASRTLLCDVGRLTWDDELLKLFDVPRRMLPAIEPSIGGDFGHVASERFGALAGVPIACVLGDQHAAAVGQCCFRPGDVKATLGTGAFVLLNTGTARYTPEHLGLLTTPLYHIKGQPAVYALEGAIAVAGSAVQWLRDNLEFETSAKGIADLASSVPDSGGVFFVPCFNGLFAPHWDATARGAVLGLTSFATKAHLARATLDAVAFQLDELCAAFSRAGVPLTDIKVDGGMSRNTHLTQFIADVLDLPTRRPKNLETTAAGAAFGAGLVVGSFASLHDLQATTWRPDLDFAPNLDAATRAQLRANWRAAVHRATGWTSIEPPAPPSLGRSRLLWLLLGLTAALLVARRRL